MKLKVITFSILLAIATVAGSVFIGNSTPVPQIYAEPVQTAPLYETPTVARLLELTNAERVKVGVEPLVLDERLNKSAQMKAEVMVSENNFSHYDSSGKLTAHRIPEYMSECEWFSENIVNNSVDINETVKAWMDSESHKTAILDSRYEYTGFGIKDGYNVQHFCDID